MSNFIVHLWTHQNKYSVHSRLRTGMEPNVEDNDFLKISVTLWRDSFQAC